MICVGDLLKNVPKDCSRTRLRGYTGQIHLYDYRGYMLDQEEHKNSMTIEANPHSISCVGKTITRKDGTSGFSHAVTFEVETENEESIKVLSSLVNIPVILFADMENGKVMRAFPFTGGKIEIENDSKQGEKADIYSITISNYFTDFFETTPPIEAGNVGEERFGDSILDITIENQFGAAEIDESTSTAVLRIEAGANGVQVPQFTLSPGATIKPVGEEFTYFGNHTFTVTNEVDKDRVWTVTYLREVGTTADIDGATLRRYYGPNILYDYNNVPLTSLNIDKENRIIDMVVFPGESIDDSNLALKLHTIDLGNQTPLWYFKQPFNVPRTYTTTSEDGNETLEWTVRVSESRPEGTYRFNAIGIQDRALISGSHYTEGATINIQAEVPAGLTFKQWRGDVQYLDNINSAATFFTMPEQECFVFAEFQGYSPDQKWTIDTNANYAKLPDEDGLGRQTEGIVCFEIYPQVASSGLGFYFHTGVLQLLGIDATQNKFISYSNGQTSYASPSLALGEWHFVKMVIRDTSHDIYINGEFKYTHTERFTNLMTYLFKSFNSSNQNNGGYIRNIYSQSYDIGESYWPMDDDFSTGIGEDVLSGRNYTWYNRNEEDLRTPMPLREGNDIIDIEYEDWMVPEVNQVGEVPFIITDNGDSGEVVVYRKHAGGAFYIYDIPFIISEGATIVPTGEYDYSLGPRSFTVTSEKQQSKIWTVRVEQSTYAFDNDIISVYTDGAFVNDIVLDQEAGTWTVPVNAFVDRANLSYNLNIRSYSNATTNKPLSGVDDFSTPWEIEVTSDAGDTRTWTIITEVVVGDTIMFEDDFEGVNKWSQDIRFNDAGDWVGLIENTIVVPDDVPEIVGPGKVEIAFKMKLESIYPSGDNDWRFRIPVSYNFEAKYFILRMDKTGTWFEGEETSSTKAAEVTQGSYHDFIILIDGNTNKFQVTQNSNLIIDHTLSALEADMVMTGYWYTYNWMSEQRGSPVSQGTRRMYLNDVSITLKG